MNRRPEILFALALAMEAAAVWTAVHAEATASGILHLCAAAAVGHGPGRRLVDGRSGWWLGFVLALLVPVWGAWGVWAASKLSRVPRQQPASHLVRTKVPGIEDAATAPSHESESSSRLPTYRHSIGALRLALKHPDEDVRLVAHTILESKSRAAYRAVHEADCALSDAADGERGEHRLRVAARHFELVRLGLADGDCRTAALQQARAQVREALECNPRDRSANFLLARIELQRRDGEAAQTALERAVELGLPDPLAAPYLAEAAFLRGRFDLVSSHFARVSQHPDLLVERMRRYWT